MPVPARIGVLYVCARVVTTLFFLGASALSGPASRFGVQPVLARLAGGWDGQWYWLIAQSGYPTQLPTGAGGAVTQNAWAFMPAYPYLARLLGGPGVGWTVAAVAISVVAGYLACLVLYRLLHARIGEDAALWAVLFFACAPLAALFQVAYAESLFLLLLFLALWAVAGRRYVWLYLLIPLMGFTRPGVLAFALFLLLHGVQRLFTRRTEPLRPVAIVHITATGVLAGIVGLAWPWLAGAITGTPDAYMQTELSWRSAWIGAQDTQFVPFDGFWRAAAFWFTTWGLGALAGYIVLILAVAALAAVLVAGPRVRAVGPEIRLWSASYLLYLLAVFFPQSSLFRLLVPLSPLWGAAAVPRSRAWRVGVLAVCLLGQWWWIYNMYALANTYWQIP